MKTPHILLASSNPYRLITQLAGLVDTPTIETLKEEVNRNARQLVTLGAEHYEFAGQLAARHWRQMISRFYYAAFNMNRAVRLLDSGHYSTDVSDHKRIGELPDTFPNQQRYANQLPSLRDDRNLCDYDHTVTESELMNTAATARQLVGDFHADVKQFFASKGVALP